KAWDGILLYCGNSLMGILAAFGLVRNRNAMAKAVGAAVVLAFVALQPGTARAGDLALKAPPKFVNPFSQAYTLTACGGYYGINTIGTSGAVQGDVSPGTQVVQGGICATVGRGCPINATNGSFWFAEALFDITNVNGNVNGLSLSGPASFTQRFGAGTP